MKSKEEITKELEKLESAKAATLNQGFQGWIEALQWVLDEEE